MRSTSFIVTAVFFLAACGGGGGETVSPPPTSEKPETEQPPQASDRDGDGVADANDAFPDDPSETTDSDGDGVGDNADAFPHDSLRSMAVTRLPFPFAAWMCDPAYAHIPGACGDDGTMTDHHSGISGLPSPTRNDMSHMPVYGDTDSNERRLFVGIDQETEHLGALGIVTSRGDNQVRFGFLNDGVGSQTLAAYLRDAIRGTVNRYSTAPEVRLIGPASDSDFQHLATAVQLINTTLPDGMKVTLGEPIPNFSLRDSVDSRGAWFAHGLELDNVIHVEYVPAGSFHSDAAATTWVWPESTGGIAHSYIQYNQGAFSYADGRGDDRVPSRQQLILLLHELMHALGMDTHVSSSFPTILEGTTDIHHGSQNGERQPMSLLYPVDREGMRALYGRLENGDIPSDFGVWSSTSMHIHGNGEHAGFGVAYRNGYAEPYAYGYRQSPYSRLAEDATGGTATWNGNIVGITPSRSAVVGDASVQVNLTALTGTADFTALETWGPNVAPGAAGSGTMWLDGDLGYTIAVNGGTTPPGKAGYLSYVFRETGGDAGRLTGIFTGASHEGATGTLERNDLTAAFGASRQ